MNPVRPLKPLLDKLFLGYNSLSSFFLVSATDVSRLLRDCLFMKLLLVLVVSLRVHFRVESFALSFAAITVVGNKSSEATRACIGTIRVWVTLIDEMRSGGVLACADLCARKSLLNLHWIYVKRPLGLSLPRSYTLASQPIVTTVHWNVNVDFIFYQ